MDSYVKILQKSHVGGQLDTMLKMRVAVKSAKESHQNLLEWFAKYLK
jgi:hypothetical protein